MYILSELECNSFYNKNKNHGTIFSDFLSIYKTNPRILLLELIEILF